MIHPKYWLKHARAKSALKDYPLYDVPHKQAEATLSETQVQENFDYFMRVRLERLAFFQKWLLDNFGVKATLDGDGLRAVSRWVDDYGGALLDPDADTMTIFATYQPRWEGEYVGYNVLIDLAVFLGEYLIVKRSRLHWEIYRGHAIEPATFKGPCYLRPQLGGMPRGWGCDVIKSGYGIIADSSKRSKCGTADSRYLATDGLASTAKDYLYISNIPDNDEPFMFGDSSNEPL